jgi:hypothetical protein
MACGPSNRPRARDVVQAQKWRRPWRTRCTACRRCGRSAASSSCAARMQARAPRGGASLPLRCWSPARWRRLQHSVPLADAAAPPLSCSTAAAAAAAAGTLEQAEARPSILSGDVAQLLRFLADR